MSIPIIAGPVGYDSWYVKLFRNMCDIIGDPKKFVLDWIASDRKLVVRTNTLTDEKLQEVNELLNRMVPSNVEVYRDPLPLEFKRLEWLRSYPPGSSWYSGSSYIVLDGFEYNQKNDTIEIETEHFMEAFSGVTEQFEGIKWSSNWKGSVLYGFMANKTAINASNAKYDDKNGYISTTISPFDKWTYFRLIKSANRLEGWIDDEIHTVRTTGFDEAKDTIVYTQVGLWGAPPESPRYMLGKKRFYKMILNGKMLFDMVPALDPTGAPCMFNLVTGTPYYSNSSVDFTYPDMETQATTYSLRNRMYAQLTEHGVRRLYHVPEDYNGSKEEYAEENGFKLLVVTPHPEEGYWTHVWHEREDCIELEWIATEAP